jgi:hypothetical protein
MLIEPRHSLQEGLLLIKLLDLLTCITPNTKSMHNPTVQINLIRLLRLNKDLLRFVAFLGRENLVRFCGRDGERARDGSEFGFLDEGGVRDETHIDAFPFRQVADGVFSSLFKKASEPCFKRMNRGLTKQ